MSAREQLQQRILTWLQARNDTFNAPYGILDGFEPFGKGKARCITFGRCRTLDAHLTIYGTDNMALRTNRGDFRFKTEQELFQALSDQFGAKL